MFSKIVSFCGKAWREARGTAGILTGGVFFLYGIVTVPLNTIPLGTLCATLTFLGTLTHTYFAYRRMAHEAELDSTPMPSSTALCLGKFNHVKNSVEVRNLFTELANSSEVMQKLNANENISEKDLREIADFFYASQTSTCQIMTQKLCSGIFWGLAQFTSHFAECMQISVLVDNKLNFKSFADLPKGDPRAIILLMVLIFALWHSAQKLNDIMQIPDASESEKIRALMSKIPHAESSPDTDGEELTYRVAMGD